MIVLLIHLEQTVQFGQNRLRCQQGFDGERPRAQHVVHRDGQEGWFDTVTGDVDQVDQQMVVVDPGVVETVTAQFPRRQVSRRHGHLAGEAAGHDRRHVGGGTGQFGGHAVVLQLKAFGQQHIALLGFDRRGDVGDLGGEVLHRPVRVTKATARDIPPDPVPVGMDVGLDRPIGIGPARDEIGDVRRGLFLVFRGRQLLPGLLHQSLRVIAEELTQRGVDFLEAAARTRQAHSDSRVVHRPPVAFIGPGLQPARFLYLLLGGHLIIDDAQRGGKTIGAAVAAVEGLRMKVKPVSGAIQGNQLRPVLDRPAFGERWPSGRKLRFLVGGNDVTEGPPDPILG